MYQPKHLKVFLTGLIAVTSSQLAYADIIVLTDGTTLNAHNVDVAAKWVYYTETPDAEGDVKRIAIDRVFAYKTDGGEMKTIGQTAPQGSNETQKADVATDDGRPRAINPTPAANNASLIAAYNSNQSFVHKKKKPNPNKYSSDFISVWGIEDGSILSDDNVEIGFEKVYFDFEKAKCVVGNLIKVTNKTARPIYIDLASSYKIMNGGYAVPYFTNSVYNENSGGSQGGAVNLGAVTGALGIGGAIGSLAGGINVGGGTSQSAGISTAEQQILTIPPYSSVTMPGMKVSDGKKIIECMEPIYFLNSTRNQAEARYSNTRLKLTISEDVKMQKVGDMPDVKVEDLCIPHWDYREFTPGDTPKRIGRAITYSTSPDFSTYTTLPVNLYMRGAFGCYVMYSHQFYLNDKDFEPIADLEHLITGIGTVKKK